MSAITDVAMRRLFAPEFQAQHPDLMRDRREAFLKSDPEVIQAACMALAELDLRPELGKVKVPVLVLVGEHDEATPPPMSRELAALLPNARLKIIAGLRPCPAAAGAGTVSGGDRRFPAGDIGGELKLNLAHVRQRHSRRQAIRRPGICCPPRRPIPRRSVAGMVRRSCATAMRHRRWRHSGPGIEPLKVMAWKAVPCPRAAGPRAV